MTQNDLPLRLHMGCGESLRSQMLVTPPRPRALPTGTRYQPHRHALLVRQLRDRPLGGIGC